MAKIGRNEPCPCGSGKKYKKCCLEIQALTPPNPLSASAQNHHSAISDSGYIVEFDDVDIASNNVLALINKGHLEEAEKAGFKLLVDYPDVNDGFERLGMLYETRGDTSLAIDMYQRALDFTLDKGDDYDEGNRDYYREKIAKLKNLDSLDTVCQHIRSSDLPEKYKSLIERLPPALLSKTEELNNLKIQIAKEQERCNSEQVKTLETNGNLNQTVTTKASEPRQIS